MAQKRTNMEMAKRLRQKLHSFCSLRTEVFSARGISNLFKNQSSTRKFVAFYTLFVSASMVPFPRRGHEKLPYISPNFSPAAKNLTFSEFFRFFSENLNFQIFSENLIFQIFPDFVVFFLVFWFLVFWFMMVVC